jgi:hypothetical protein
MIATIHLTENRDCTYRDWDGTQANLDARLAGATIVHADVLTGPLLTDAAVQGLLNRIYGFANGHPNAGDEDLSTGYYANQVRSLSVGDVIELPGHGLYCVSGFGFTLATTAGLPI